MHKKPVFIQVFSLSVIFFLALFSSSLHAQDLSYLPAGQPDFIALVPAPPAADSAEQAADLAEVAAVHNACTKSELALAFSEAKFSILSFTPAVGPIFQPGKLAKTEAFLGRVLSDTKTIINTAKNYWKRPRPYTVDPKLASGVLEPSFSYPSGHSAEGTVIALVLADLFPNKRGGIIAIGRNIGWHRVEIAYHFSTDVFAGRVFAQAIAREMKQSAAYQRDFAEAQSEIEKALRTSDVAANSAK